MKNLFLLVVLLFWVWALNAQTLDCKCKDDQPTASTSAFSDLSGDEKREAVKSLILGNCYFKGVKLWGKVRFVDSSPDIRIQYVDSFPDLNVQFVDAFPDKCGLWERVEIFPDFTVQVVDSFPDIRVKIVDSLPGVGE